MVAHYLKATLLITRLKVLVGDLLVRGHLNFRDNHNYFGVTPEILDKNGQAHGSIICVYLNIPYN